MNVFELIKEKIKNCDIEYPYFAQCDNNEPIKNQMLNTVDEVAQEYPKTPTPDHPIPLDTQQYIAELEARVNNNGWIPCSERLPEECIEVLVTVKEIDEDYYTTTSWFQEGAWCIKKSVFQPTVTHWQPLPAPYKEGGTE